MKNLIAGIILLAPLTAQAQSDYLVQWSIAPGLSIDVQTLELDISLLQKYITLNGALIDADQGHIAATGSCFQITAGGISCAFDSANRNFELDITDALTGTLTERDSNGNQLGAALVQPISIK